MSKKLKIGFNKKELLLLDENENILPYQTSLKIESDCGDLPVLTVTFALLDFEKIELND
jgi:hypothetical protein